MDKIGELDPEGSFRRKGDRGRESLSESRVMEGDSKCHIQQERLEYMFHSTLIKI